ncbi:MAG TPA: 1,4-alpha-glucan branching protein GlgB [Caldilineaceae bacterium]|nr:1,4-alpha-glucan branching protein GlgB [Caldilineaceae bacterium]
MTVDEMHYGGVTANGSTQLPPAVTQNTGTANPGDIQAIVYGYHGAPFAVLGPHVVPANGEGVVVIRAFRPLDAEVYVLDLTTGERTQMARIHEAGFFEARFPQRDQAFPYRLIVVDPAGRTYELEDPYRFPPWLTEYDLFLFGEGNLLYSYEKFGAHFREIDGVRGVNFAVWAPNAERVSVIGPFNGWDNRAHPMRQHQPSGVWELFIPNLPEGMHYKYAVKSRFLGYEIDKSDPYGFYAELRPSTDSRVWDLGKYVWGDEEWIANRPARQALDQPINIYEVHLGSWRRAPENNGFLHYRDLAHQLVEYVQQMGYTHIELLPITEHPFDGSWGYQTTGYYAPTSRFGTPDDFKYFVDYCHRHGIGIILDWVPAHFPRDAHGLAFFDGTHLYEHSDPRLGEHQEWGTKIFNYGRNEVRNFLVSNALFWLKEYHLDGLRVDAVASMLYLDYSREPGQWLPNRYGGRENLEAIDFIRRFNEVSHAEVPGALTIAEESTSWPMVTRPTHVGGLGFDLKWNMGWMHDTLSYMQKDPIHRRYHQNQVTFSLIYAFHENFVLPLSHDEVVHLKRSLLDKMPGDVWQKYANLRALYGYMTAHPGKKLLFMGGEFGQWAEWSEARSLDWHLLQWQDHQRLQHYVATLNHLYRQEPALYTVDASWEGFEWIDIADAEKSIISFVRRAPDPTDCIVVVCNFTPVPRLQYRVGLPLDGTYREILNSDAGEFGGSGVGNVNLVNAEAIAWQRCAFSAPLNLPPLGVIFLKPIRR